MTKVVKPDKARPIPHDPALAAEEVERRQRNAGNETLQRNIKAAVATEHQRLRNEIAGEIAALGRIKKGRGSVEARRGNYTRAYQRGERAAKVLFAATGVPVPYPEFDPPTEVTSTRMIAVGPDPLPSYIETRGKGSTGTGLPLKGPGSQIDPEWVDK